MANSRILCLFWFHLTVLEAYSRKLDCCPRGTWGMEAPTWGSWCPPRATSHPHLSPHLTQETDTEGQPTLTHDQLWLLGEILLKHLYSNQILPLFCSLETERWMRAIIQQHWGFFDVWGRSEILKCNFMLSTNTGLKMRLWGVFYWLHLFSSHLQTFLLCLEKKTTWMQTSS